MQWGTGLIIGMSAESIFGSYRTYNGIFRAGKGNDQGSLGRKKYKKIEKKGDKKGCSLVTGAGQYMCLALCA